MRTNTVNIIMTGVAIADLANMAYIIFTKVLTIIAQPGCFNNYGFYKIFMEQWFQCADEMFRPSSAWLSVIISLVRVLVIGLTVILPILTVLLVMEIRKAERNRNNVMASQRTSTKNNQTTNMIFFITLASMISEGLYGLLQFLLIVYQDDDYNNDSNRRMIFFITSLMSVNDILIVLNTMSHCFFSLMLSSQYKNTAKNLFICRVLGVPKLTSNKSVSNINVASSTSASTNHELVKVD
ncbi:unnamed protein product [Caenorhabditis nigoni]